MNNPYRGGTPDVWYSGNLGDLWVEYKFLPKIPKSNAIDLGLSPLQLHWINSRSAEGRSVWVIVGCPDGGIILKDGAWDVPISKEEFEVRILTHIQIAQAIGLKTGVSDVVPTRRVHSGKGRAVGS